MRLIDADALEESLENSCKDTYETKMFVDFMNYVDESPTIKQSEDCISRKKLRKLICQNNDKYGYSDRFHEFTEQCLQLPSITSQPKMGEWIAMSEGFSPYQCSECETVEFKKSSYCPNCGCRMNGGGEE